MRVSLRTIALLALLPGACAPPPSPPQGPTPADLPALRARARLDPSAEAQVALGAALRAAGQRDSARALLTRVVSAHPRNAAAKFYLGLTAEDLGDYARAEALYQEYLGLGGFAAPGKEVRERLGLVRRKALAAAVQNALASEAQLSRQAPEPRTVAVFPFVYGGADTRMQPLGRALSALLTTDLAQTSRLRVLERTQVQALIAEIKLSGSGLVDSSTAVRSGRLLRASRIVQGQVGGTEQALRIAAAVTGVGGDAGRRRSPVQVQDALARLFDMEKAVALRLYGAMGIQLTVAERERVSRRATENLDALLEFGWGLEAEDAGQYGEAARRFARAAQLDPNFAEARRHAQEDGALAAAAGLSTDALARLAVGEAPALARAAVPAPPLMQAGFRPQAISTLGLDAIRTLLPDPIFRSGGPEVLGLDGVAAPATLVITIRRP